MLFNNAIYKGVGTLDRVADLTSESMLNMFTGNFVHQVLLIQAVLPHMLERGSGTIIDMVSGSARLDPPGAAGEGGWGILYSASKAAFGRVAGGINAEHRSAGMRAFNVDPGNVVTEARKAIKTDDEYSAGYGSEPAEATGKVVAWLATDPGRRPVPRQVDLRPEAVLRPGPVARLDVRASRLRVSASGDGVGVAPGAQHHARRGAGRRAVLDHRHAADEHPHDALGTGGETGGVAGEVGDERGVVGADRLGVEQHEVGDRALAQHAAVAQPEQRRRLRW